MMGTSFRQVSKNKLVKALWKWAHFALPLAFFLAMFFIFPFRERFEFDLDEGLNAMKALLVARGYPLYSQIWSDQPPLLTYLLAFCIRIFGANIDAARTLILSLSAILMAAAVHFLRKAWGFWHAAAGALLLTLLPFYTSLSVAVMVGLPAIALAVLSLAALEGWHKQRKIAWLALSATFLALSVLTKLFTGLLAPIFLLGIFLGERRAQRWSARLYPALVWSVIFGAVLGGLGFVLVGPANLSQLVVTHLFARSDPSFLALANSQPIQWHLRESLPVLLLAGLGCVFVILERRWTSLYLAGWAALAYGLLSFHAPVWYHHQFLVTVPAALLAAIAIGEAIRRLPQVLRLHSPLNALLVLLALVGFGATLAVRARLTYHTFILPAYLIPPEAPSAGREMPFLVEMSARAENTRWVVTDLPMYAFRAGLSVPPPLAAITDKRLSGGELTEAQIIEAIETYRPEQILLGRFELPAVETYLKDDYKRVFQWGRKTLYFHGELKRLP